MALEYHLNLDGFDVVTAENGQAGIRHAIEIRPNIIILDYLMPGMSGMKVLVNLKNDTRTSHIPIFMCTHMSSIQDREKMLTLGADDVISKPFDAEEISMRILRKYELYKEKHPELFAPVQGELESGCEAEETIWQGD